MILKKKSQVFGQIFIYILAIIIFSLVLLYGYRAIKNFSNKAEDVSLIQLTTDIKTSVNKIKSDYGTVIKKELSISGNYIYICFIDLDYPADISLRDEHPAVYNSWYDQAQSNMFLITSREEIQPYYIAGIKIKGDNQYVCIDVKQGKIVLKLEGKGDYVELSEWE